jgi:hypothetical protein
MILFFIETWKSNKGESLQKCALLFLLVALNIADLITTVYGFTLGASELNPLFPGKSFATLELLIIKLWLPCGFLCSFTLAERFSKDFPAGELMIKISLGVLLCLCACIVTNNIVGIINYRISRGLSDVVR